LKKHIIPRMQIGQKLSLIKQQNKQRAGVELEIKERVDSIWNATIIIYNCIATLNYF
jgi:hypothetical protein